MTIHYEIREITPNANVLVLRGSIDDISQDFHKFLSMLEHHYPLEKYKHSFYREQIQIVPLSP